MKSFLGIVLLLASFSLAAQNKWSFTAETSLTLDRFNVDDGSTWYGRNNGGPYLFNTSSTGFLGGFSARYRIGKCLYAESGIYLKSDNVTVNMQHFEERSLGRQNSWLIPLRFGTLLPLGTSKFYLTPSIGVSLGVPGGKKTLTGDFRDEPVTFSSRRVFFSEHKVNEGGLSTFAEAGVGIAYQLSEKLSLGLQTRYLLRTTGAPDQDTYYGVGFGDGYRFLATQKKSGTLTAGLLVAYEF